MIPVRLNQTIPFNHVHRMFEEMMRDDFFGALPQKGSHKEKEFSADIYEKDGAYILKADMPGMEKKDVTIDLSDNLLTISAQKTETHEVKREDYYKKERFSGTFKRSFTLSDRVDQEAIQAGMENGVLTITLPHSDKKEVRQITVN